ncbi:MAG: 4Fe-4S dicluster domain-containing protein [Desulfuromonadaceae bacterium]|nr:4Fe-4S dicluster domain-containing protein [Desulfuromonadaceae bacterium]
MYRIRFHGRGGQGMKTASRILGTAFFLEGFEVQDAPRYGAERRGAPIFAYVRASRNAIFERGIIRRPDLVVVADDTLVAIPSAGVLQGVAESAVVLICSNEKPGFWKSRYPLPEKVVTLPVSEEGQREHRFISASCAGAAACLSGVVSKDCLKKAIHQELSDHEEDVVKENLSRALNAYELMMPYGDLINPGAGEGESPFTKPDWIDLPFEEARISAPSIHAALTSEKVKTGLWRTMRPVIDYDRCQRCGLCSQLCPEGAISLNAEGYPVIDYEHCKGCLICVAQCPTHAVGTVPEEHGREKGNSAGGEK